MFRHCAKYEPLHDVSLSDMLKSGDTMVHHPRDPLPCLDPFYFVPSQLINWHMVSPEFLLTPDAYFRLKGECPYLRPVTGPRNPHNKKAERQLHRRAKLKWSRPL